MFNNNNNNKNAEKCRKTVKNILKTFLNPFKELEGMRLNEEYKELAPSAPSTPSVPVFDSISATAPSIDQYSASAPPSSASVPAYEINQSPSAPICSPSAPQFDEGEEGGSTKCSIEDYYMEHQGKLSLQ